MIKNYFWSLLTIGALVISSCSNDNDENLQQQIIPTNTETISLFETAPDSSLDTSNRGLYHGVFSSRDLSLKGKIYVQVQDNEYRAEVQLRDGEILKFTANPTDAINNIEFSNERGSFTLDITDIDHTVATNVVLDTKEGYIQVFKDRSNQRIAMELGTFVDSADPTFTGNWDMATDGTAHPDDEFFDGFETISEIIVSINGQMFMDTNPDVEGFDFNCALGGDVIFDISQAGLTNEYLGEEVSLLEGYNQIATYNGVDIMWNASLISPDEDPDDFLGCESTTGTWSTVGGGRSGTFSFD